MVLTVDGTTIEYRPLRADGCPHCVAYSPPVGTVRVLGELWYPVNHRDLDQDIVSFELADGTYLDVGFYPSYDPTGHYKVVHFGDGIGDGCFGDGRVILESRSIEEVARCVSDFRTNA